ncbi:MAG TPA: glycosyltransferase [Methylomirabilota bacterium]|jgi:dolichol-phosphate mannosyltransferase|nr:glycosyltransferase [Methylomirabilota bacterium]
MAIAGRQPLPVASPPSPGPVELSVIVPTYNERGNVAPLVTRLEATLAGVAWEAVFVDDDSPDGTAREVKTIAARDPRVRCLRRVNRRGLAGACIEGILGSSAPYVAVIDADLQHDETLLPRMLDSLKSGRSDLVVATRFGAGGSAQAMSPTRESGSRLARRLAWMLGGVALSDPMSGFFAIRRDRFEPLAASLSPDGFKILLDIVMRARGTLRVAEEPYSFGPRVYGKSKLDARVVLEYLGLLLSRASRDAVTPRFLSHALVGVVGLVVQLVAMRVGLALGLAFIQAYALGAVVALGASFVVTNLLLTHSDRRLRGFSVIPGLLVFGVTSAFGLVAGIGVAAWLYTLRPVWWLAGAVGSVVGTVCSHATSPRLSWHVK